MDETEYSPQNYTLFCQFILYIYLSLNHLKIVNARVHNSTQIPKQQADYLKDPSSELYKYI